MIPQAKVMNLQDYSKRYKERPFLPRHLLNPFIYIEKVLKKGTYAICNHPDKWNNSNNLSS